ncbi:MAG: SDR family oxidoreductase [Halofilum sp. (in: g-proteobacteria)]|nr:SDR family oxidoreductase [Halofilum sp. (in: g-proteobacteria)]
MRSTPCAPTCSPGTPCSSPAAAAASTSAIARAYARLGAAVGICGRDAERLERARTEIEAAGARAVATAVADVRDPGRARGRAGAGSRAELGALSTLVCGAAGNFLAPAETLSPNGFRAVVDIDLNGSFHASRAAFGQLRETGGDVVMISAVHAVQAFAGQAHVCAAKAGVEQLMRTLALEWGRHGIRANAIEPGPIEDTEGVRRLLPGDAVARAARIVPLGRLGRTEDIGAAAAFLSSPLAAYVSGTVLTVDGGGSLGGSGPWNAFFADAMAAAGERA